MQKISVDNLSGHSCKWSAFTSDLKPNNRQRLVGQIRFDGRHRLINN